MTRLASAWKVASSNPDRTLMLYAGGLHGLGTGPGSTDDVRFWNGLGPGLNDTLYRTLFIYFVNKKFFVVALILRS